jgi:hypothetical protein
MLINIHILIFGAMQHVNAQDDQNVLYKNKLSTKHCVAIVHNIYIMFKYLLSFEVLHPVQGSGSLNYLLLSVSILYNFLPAVYVQTPYVSQNVIFPACFRSPD